MRLEHDSDSQDTSGDGDLDQSVPPTVTSVDKSPAVCASISCSSPLEVANLQDGHLNKDENAVPLQDNTNNDELRTNPNKPPDFKAPIWMCQWNPDIELQPGTRGLLNSASLGLQNRISPSRHRPDGGTYFMRNRRGDSTTGIFKTTDEEAKEANSARGLKQGTQVGKAALAEVACFLLDNPRSGPWVDDDMKGGLSKHGETVTIKILYDDALQKVVVEGDMKKGFSTHGVPLTIGTLYEGEFCKVVHSEMKNGPSAPGVAVLIEFHYNGALRKVVVEGNMKKGFSTRGVPLIIGIMFVGAFREVVFDGKTNNGFSGVPLTVMIGCLNKGFNHPKGFNGETESSNIKVGSLQRYIQNSRSCAVMEDPWNFPVAKVHKIAVLDLRVGNADRHAANILWKRQGDGSYKLFPINHGSSLPESFEDFKFVWLEWPQARQQFSVETLDYIKSLDAEKDIKLLKSNKLKFSKLSLCNLRIMTSLLKDGAERGMSPYQIGRILCRDNDEKSVIEKVLEEARALTFTEVMYCLVGLDEKRLSKVTTNCISGRVVVIYMRLPMICLYKVSLILSPSLSSFNYNLKQFD